jgi:transcription elongation factor GreA
VVVYYYLKRIFDIMGDVVITRQGYENLCEKLKKLKSVDRQVVIKEIQTAAAHGDLSENAEYDAAKEKQMFLEKQINDLEQSLSNPEIIDPAGITSDKVVFGATVQLEDEDRGGETIYQIVGVDESDVSQGKISISSPIARALIGKEAGDYVEVKTPGGLRSYSILEITYK